MNIAVIGPGAMGLLFGGYLSRKHQVTLVGTRPEVMRGIEESGVTIREADGTQAVYHPRATADPAALSPADLVILFVKSGASRAALEAGRSLIGKDTLLLTLQNGAGHEAVLRHFTDDEHIIIGTTQQGSYRLSASSICHSGGGSTSLGAVCGSSERFAPVAQAFEECGFPCSLTDHVRGMIWNKLMINASSSVLSGILQMPQGYVIQNEGAWDVACRLIRELCAVATADGYPFDAAEQIQRIHRHLENAPDGYTSIYADLKAGRTTEAAVINGAVVDAARRLGVPAPTHEIILALVQALEQRPASSDS